MRDCASRGCCTTDIHTKMTSVGHSDGPDLSRLDNARLCSQLRVLSEQFGLLGGVCDELPSFGNPGGSGGWSPLWNLRLILLMRGASKCEGHSQEAGMHILVRGGRLVVAGWPFWER